MTCGLSPGGAAGRRGVELPVRSVDAVEWRLVPAHRVWERGVEQAVVAAQQSSEPVGQRVALVIVKVRKPGHGLAGDDQRLEGPGGPERDHDQPVVVASEIPRSAHFLLGVIEQKTVPGRLEVRR